MSGQDHSHVSPRSDDVISNLDLRLQNKQRNDKNNNNNNNAPAIAQDS